MIPRLKNNYIHQSGNRVNWNLTIDPLPTKFDNYFVESCRAAEEIYANKTGKLHVMYSGGIDSEYALNVFLHLGMDVTPVVVNLMPGYNFHDLMYAHKFCNAKNIRLVEIEIDFIDFVESGRILDLAVEMKTSSPMRPAIAHAIESLNGSIVIGEGDPHLTKKDNGEWVFDIDEHDYAIENYLNLKGIDGTSFFNRYTPEQMAAFLTDPRMRELANNEHVGKLGSHSSKHIVYNRHSNFDLLVRAKYNGYEALEKSVIWQHPYIKAIEALDHNGYFSANYFDFVSKFA